MREKCFPQKFKVTQNEYSGLLFNSPKRTHMKSNLSKKHIVVSLGFGAVMELVSTQMCAEPNSGHHMDNVCG